ncbi:MAG: sugar phosphate isomerase/epimerase [Desulfosarcinaceae bacterium]|jgi:sugar phosphate isomerase/epimerase
MNPALSTSFAGGPGDARLLMHDLEQLGVRAVELEYRLGRKVFQDLKPLLREAGIAVVSLHNYCPFPQLMPKAGPSGDYFRLSATDREERDLAVAWTARTLEAAHDLEARAVVLHCGLVQKPSRRAEFYHCFRTHGSESQAYQNLLAAEQERLDAAKAPFMDALMFSLDKLLPAADRLDLTLGLEIRYHYDELPGFADMERLLAEFAGGPVGYWHDCGHAHAQEILGLNTQLQWLERFKQDLVGAHLHDARGLEDHLAPGKGEIDFNAVVSALDPSKPAVLELAPGTTHGDIKHGIDYLRQLTPGATDGQDPANR